jgi:MSHA biogenesis protein MshL
MNHAPFPLKLLGSLASAALISACAPIATVNPAGMPSGTPVQTLVNSPATEAALAARKAAVIADATPLAPPIAAPAPAPAVAQPSEPRIDLIVNNAPARDVFLALAADGRFNVLVHPDLTGTVSVTLRRVTLFEALQALREVYGYDFRVEGRRIAVFPPTLQSRVFVINYLHSQRSGRSDVRVSSGAAPANGASTSGASGANNTSGSGTAQPDSSQITTQSKNDLWGELGEAVRTMIGNKDGRSVVISPQSGLLAVRAMPDELRRVDDLLKAARLAVERQVMLDVKIVQVELREGFESGIDWSVLRGRGAIGSTSGNPNNPLITNANGLPVLPAATSLLNNLVNLPAPANGLFGLSLAGNGFQAVLGFLETHGEVQTLSSPRLATLNNQKAVLKVGTDDYFVTNVSGGTVNNTSSGTANTTTTMPTLTLTPFFSGIALDVTPQIDEGHMITLHVHPSVSSVSERNKQVDLGTMGAYKLPLASSSINETDTIVRIPDGQIVAIGGLMQMETARQTSGLPGSAENALTASVLGNRNNTGRKKELVVLIKPSIIRSAEDWQDHTQAAWAALEGKDEPVRVIRLDGPPPSPVHSARPAVRSGLELTQEALAAEPVSVPTPAPTPARKAKRPAATSTTPP